MRTIILCIVCLWVLYPSLAARGDREEPPDLYEEQVKEDSRGILLRRDRETAVTPEPGVPGERPTMTGEAAETTDAGTSAGPFTEEELVVRALSENPELLILKSEYRQSLLDVRSAKAGFSPKMDVQVSAGHIANPMEMELKQGSFGTYDILGQETQIPPETITILEPENFNYNFKLIVEQPVFTWGKIPNSVRLYIAASTVKLLQIEKLEQELETKVRILMKTLALLEQIEGVLREQLELSDRLIYIAEESYENGFSIYSDLLTTRIKVKEIELGAAEIREKIDNALLELGEAAAMDNLSPDFLVHPEIRDDPGAYTIATREELIDAALLESVDLRLLDRLRRISDLKVSLAKGNWYFKPNLALRFELSYGGPRFPFIETGWFGEDDYGLISSLALVTTVWDGGKVVADIRLSEEERNAAAYEYEHGRRAIEKFISSTLLKLNLQRDKIEYARLKIENDEQLEDLKQTQFDTGAISESDYLTQQLDTLTDRIDLYTQGIEFFTHYYSLLSVTGGL